MHPSTTDVRNAVQRDAHMKTGHGLSTLPLASSHRVPSRFAVCSFATGVRLGSVEMRRAVQHHYFSVSANAGGSRAVTKVVSGSVAGIGGWDRREEAGGGRAGGQSGRIEGRTHSLDP